VIHSHDPFIRKELRMARTTSELDTMDPRLLTQFQKQDRVLAELPEDYEFPLF
jgi:hypothetical protein